MPYDDPDSTDPMTLNGVVVDTDNDQAMRGMAECFIEEYFRLGYDREGLMKLFKTRGYAGPHLAYQTLGDQTIAALIDEYVQRWGSRRPAPPDDAVPDSDGISLPIIESPPLAHMGADDNPTPRDAAPSYVEE
jgi:hypothetical protein